MEGPSLKVTQTLDVSGVCRNQPKYYLGEALHAGDDPNVYNRWWVGTNGL